MAAFNISRAEPVDPYSFLALRHVEPCVLWGSRSLPIVLLNVDGRSPGTAPDCMLGTGKVHLKPWPGKSTKWTDSSHSAWRILHSCTLFYSQGEKTVWKRERRKGGGQGSSWAGQALKTMRLVCFEDKKKRFQLGLDVKLHSGSLGT